MVSLEVHRKPIVNQSLAAVLLIDPFAAGIRYSTTSLFLPLRCEISGSRYERSSPPSKEPLVCLCRGKALGQKCLIRKDYLEPFTRALQIRHFSQNTLWAGRLADCVLRSQRRLPRLLPAGEGETHGLLWPSGRGVFSG
jgi:hypothetical protein